jgi:tRNA A-37 threonylcarbamoyl transferase component Bud32
MALTDRKCPRCGGSVAEASRFCPVCGLPVARLSPGQILDGKYEILDKIGEGGMGEVYRARHIHLDEIRIIKVTKPDAPGEGNDPRRFQEEARIATLVRHPNVAALYDFSQHPDGSYYMVWEFIDGVTLQQWLRRHGPIALPRALDVAQQVLAGLGEIHSQGIVHRDLSPDNIMLREVSGGRLQAKIIDLGIAKRVTAESLQMTGTGMFLGKLKYGSPEQAGSLPSGQTIDGRSDLYSLGVVLYEMLTGKAPFEAQTPQEYLGKHLHQAPPPLDVSRLPSAVGPAVAAVVTKALEKDRERRFRDPKEFADALSNLTPLAASAEGKPEVAATIATRADPLRKPTWVAVLFVALAIGAGMWALTRRQKPRPVTLGPRLSAGRWTATEPASTRSPTEAVPETTVTAPRALSVVRGADPGSFRRKRPQASATLAPTIVPTPIPTATETPTPAPEPNAEKRRQRLQSWMAHAIEERARRAGDIAQWANKVAAAHPNAPDVLQLKVDLPALFKRETLGALDRGRPFLATLFYRAYLSLDFAPADSGLARRVYAAVPHPRRTPQSPP